MINQIWENETESACKKPVGSIRKLYYNRTIIEALTWLITLGLMIYKIVRAVMILLMNNFLFHYCLMR